MPLNEARGRTSRSNLTKEQKRQAEAAIYGLQEIEAVQNELSHADIERMRAILAQHDNKDRGSIKEFDLNNPPKEPYVHQEFPKVMYHHGKRQMKKANTPEDMDEALESGWSKEPFPSEAEPVELDADSASEAAALDAKLRKKRG